MIDPTPSDPATTSEPSRRGALKLLGVLLTAAIGLVLAVPGVGFLLTPLLGGRGGKAGGFTPLARFEDLEVGVPRAFPVIESRRDAWVRYPAEPVGTVWLVRQPEGAEVPVLALSAECPHLACAVVLGPDGREFFCPCHTSAFNLKGERLNKVPPRGMDRLEVEPFDPKQSGALVRVRFRRFRTMTEETIPLG